MEPKKNKNVIKECQKYIYIKPSLRQLYFSDSADVDGIFSTIEKKKKYKMRITSKGSGKKIDFNFSFVKKIDEEIENWLNINKKTNYLIKMRRKNGFSR